RGAPPDASRRRRERVAALPAREPLRGSQWVECRCRRSSRFAPLNSDSWFSPIEFIATSEPVPDTRTRLGRRGRVTKRAPSRVHCLVIIMLPIIHPHPPNRKTTRKHETPKHSSPQQHSTFTKTPPCTTHETNAMPIEYRNTLTHNNIQKHPKRALTTPPHDPAPLPHTTQPEHPAGAPHTPGHALTAGQRHLSKSRPWLFPCSSPQLSAILLS
ncbi:hypothetical protein M2251_000318, partial [Rhodococcus erythropolis]|nr:hypothetical protein [Rhodococcus erythropolis]